MKVLSKEPNQLKKALNLKKKKKRSLNKEDAFTILKKLLHKMTSKTLVI